MTSTSHQKHEPYCMTSKRWTRPVLLVIVPCCCHGRRDVVAVDGRYVATENAYVS